MRYQNSVELPTVWDEWSVIPPVYRKQKNESVFIRFGLDGDFPYFTDGCSDIWDKKQSSLTFKGRNKVIIFLKQYFSVSVPYCK